MRAHLTRAYRKQHYSVRLTEWDEGEKARNARPSF